MAIIYYWMPHFLKSMLLLVCLFPAIANAFCFDEAGQKYAISPVLLESIARTESNLDQKATNLNRNGSVDIGLMQVNSFWIRTLGFDRDRLLNDGCYNTMAGARILRQCIDSYGYTWEAVGCYNAASLDKKKSYSWKIFRRLKQASRQADKTANQQAPSSLSFRVRDTKNWQADAGVTP